MDTKLSIKEIEEMIISNEVSLRNEIAIPNLSFGMLPYEADIVVINKDGYMREYEIKRSMTDLKADLKKKCLHKSEIVYQFFYVLPVSIKEKALELFRQHQADNAYVKVFGRTTEYYEALPAIIFYNDDGVIVERTRKKGYLSGKHRKLFLEERLTATRLLSIRYWNLRMKEKEQGNAQALAMQQNQTNNTLNTTTMETIKPSNRNRIRRALKHIKTASAELVNMKGKDMTSEYNAQRNNCLRELSKAFDAISDFRCIAENEQMIPKTKTIC